MNCGINIGDNEFIWGHELGEKDLNYNLIYFVHESLHSYFKNNLLTHTIIEKITDIEIAKYLNNSKKGYRYHDFTRDYHIKIFPLWNLYIGKTPKEIEDEKILLSIDYDTTIFQKYCDQLE